MGSIRIGEREPSLLRLGDTEAYAAYAGDERVWPGTETKLWLHLTSKRSVTLYYDGLLASTPYMIDWGDGKSETYSGSSRTHAYAGAGDYVVRMRPTGNEIRAFGYGLALNDNIFGIGAGGAKTGTSPELTRLEIGGLAGNITSWAFAGCTSLRAVTVPGHVLTIEQQAFKGCAGLVLAEIGAHRLGADVVKSCPALQKLWLRESVETIGADSLRDIGPTGALTIYCEADEKPASWPAGWNPGGFPVTWGQKVRPW